MGADLFERRPDLLGGAANDVLGWDLESLCADGPEEELTRTEHAQPALYALAYALWDEFRQAVRHAPSAAAGHSLGEYTALAAAGACGFLDGLRLVSARGKAMAAAADAEPSGMAALLGADPATAEALAAAARAGGGRLWVANLNAPGQVVVAGSAADIAWASEHGKEHGVRRVVPLKVAGAFHTPFMAPAVPEFSAVVAEQHFAAPQFPVWGNTDARPIGDDVAGVLARQLVSPVRFADALEAMAADGIEAFVHVGPGDVTAGMARRTVPDIDVFVVDDLTSISPVAEAVSA